MKHFIIFERSTGHCIIRLERAPSLREAITAYFVREQWADVLEDGSIRVDTSYGGSGGEAIFTFTHPLACIESFEKADDCNGTSWQIKELWDQHWQSPSAVLLYSIDPEDINAFIETCRPTFRAAFPNSRAKAFVWSLKDGPLVTFYRRKRPKHQRPIEVIARYKMFWGNWETVQPWHGTYDDILEQMLVKDDFSP